MDWSCFENKESEKNWERRDAVMQALQKKPIEIDRVQLDYVCSAINSLRTQLQFNALLAVESLIQSNNMDPYAEILLAGLFKVISGSKKVVSQPSINAASLLIQNTQPTSRILAILSKMSKEKGVVVRNSTVLLLTIFYQNTLDSNWLVKSHSMDVFAKIIVRLLHDADSSVREHARTLFLLFESNDFQNSQKVLSNVQDHILKSISRDRSKITQSRLTAPPIPIEMSPKKAKSVIVLNRSTSRDSSDSDISAKSSPSSYHSRPRTAKLLDSNTFFDDVLGNINKSFDEVTGIESNNIVPVLPNESESEFNHSNPDIIVDDGDVEPEINQILNSTSDRFTVENFNTLQGLSKQHPVFNNQQDKNQVWNIATCQAVLDKIIHIVGESPEDEPKEDCFILLQHIITNQGLLIQGQESAVLSCTLKYHEFDKDHVNNAHLVKSSWILLLHSMRIHAKTRPLIQSFV
eukprot:NODE_541_length_6897_cov_0.247426.p1 type:complete len:463 gc:universal NODE_541_length_6897_cov_0.247426:2536-1148(-)